MTDKDVRAVICTLEELHAVLERLRGEFIHGITGPAEYERATALLDELTSGRELSAVEEKILIELEEAILDYQHESDQFRESNAAFETTGSPVQLIRDLMQTLGLSGSDLPEIGDKTAVSKVLNGTRPISHKMAYALAERFAIEPVAFLPTTPAVATPAQTRGPALAKNLVPGYSRNSPQTVCQVRESTAGEYQAAASQVRGRASKGPKKA